MKEKLLKIINRYGVDNQQRKFAEEVFELQKSITECEIEYQYFDIDTDLNNALILSKLEICKNNVAEEIADVLVMLEQFRLYYDIELKDVKEIGRNKIHRQLKRMEEENNE